MKKFCIFASLMLALGVFSGCQDDRDSNPKLINPDPDSFVLNVPTGSDTEVYDLKNSDGIVLTFTQPNYGGFPMQLHYAVELATSADEATATFKYLATGSDQTPLTVKASEVNEAIYEIWTEENGEDTPKPPTLDMTVYLRVHAYTNNDNVNAVWSNFVPVNVRGYYEDPGVTLPTELYICGNVTGAGDWQCWKKLVAVNGMAGKFFTIIYAGSDAQFKWGTRPQEWLGYGDVNAYNVDTEEILVQAASDGNIQVNKAGWYTIYMEAKLKGSKVEYSMSALPARMYVIGAVAGGDWTDSAEAWELTAPADGSGEWVSPEFTGGGETRAYAKVGTFDWWRTEFTLHEGKVFWRENLDIPSNWNDNVGADYSVAGAPGNKLYIKNDDGTGAGAGRVE